MTEKFSPHGAGRAARAASSAPWIIYLTHRVPFPPDKGDRIRTFNILRYLATRTQVLLGCVADEPVPEEHLRVLKGLCAEVCVIDNTSIRRWMRGAMSFATGCTISEGLFYQPDLERRLARWLTEYPVAACLLSASSLAPYLRAPGMGQIPAVVDLIDVDSQKWLDYAGVFRGWRRWVYRGEGGRLRRLESDLARTVQAVTLVSEAECRLFRSFCGDGQVLAVPNGVDLEYFSPRPEPVTGPSCVFVGAMDYPPNVDAVVWFADQVWPGVLQARPEARWDIVGRQPTDAVRELGRRPGITVVGQVPDVRDYVARAAAVVAPLRIARGIQNKVLEALAMAKPVVASSAAMEGLAVSDGRELLRADTPSEWIDALLRLWNDSAQRNELGRAGRNYVERHHSWDRCLEEFARLLKLPAMRTE